MIGSCWPIPAFARTSLSRCAWDSLKVFLQDAKTSAECFFVLSTFYSGDGMFRVSPPFELKKLEAKFRHKVLRMLQNEGKITQEMIAMLSTWRHSGFNVFCGNHISPDDDTAMEKLARYIIRASGGDMFRKPAGIGTGPRNEMQYLDQEGTVVYKSKDGATTRNFPALERLAAMRSHIPNRGEQVVRYYRHYSNAHSASSGQVSRGKRQQAGLDDAIPCILEPQGNEKAFRKSWSRLIQKIYEVDPRVCPKPVLSLSKDVWG